MSQFFQSIFNPVCLSCGSFFVESHLFCEECFANKIKPHLKIKKRVIQNKMHKHHHFYLFDWVLGEADLFSKMIYVMKQSKAEAAIHFYARVLSQELLLEAEFQTDQNRIILPLAGSKKSSTHALCLALNMAFELGYECYDVYEKVMNSVEQKKKTAVERKKNQIQLKTSPEVNVQITKLCSSHNRALFVDDVLTTGNSFMQSIDLLDKGLEADILTLFYRAKAHESSLVVRD